MNMTGTQTLETRRLILRQFRPGDAQYMYDNWASDPEVTRFLTWPAHSSPAITRMVLEDWISHYEEGGFFNWAIEWKESGQVIGNVSVVRPIFGDEVAEIGYCLGRAYWGRGIMPEAVRAVTGYLFGTVGVNRIVAYHDVHNPQSGRVMEKAGMTREGVLRQGGRNNQGFCDVAVYGIVRGDSGPRERLEPVPVTVRSAREEDLGQVNNLRRQVNDLHVEGKPEIFKPGFCDALRDYVHEIMKDPNKEILVAETNGQICGFAVLNHIVRPENPFMYERDYLDIDEFCVGEGFRRRGVGSALIQASRNYAKEKGFRRIELNMWEFNREALAFYEAAGFTTYRRYMEG